MFQNTITVNLKRKDDNFHLRPLGDIHIGNMACDIEKLQKNIDLGVEQQQELNIYGQASAVHSIIYNLIDNAIKYTPKHGVINVSILQQAEAVLLQIEDSGTGIDPAQFNQIRQRFYRIHNHAEIGSGLGLSIVDKATQRLGATLEFSKSTSLGGLCVQVKFPSTATQPHTIHSTEA